MEHPNWRQIAVLTFAFLSGTLLPADTTQLSSTQLTTVAIIASSVGICGGLYYYLMLSQEQKLHKQQESFINQLILDQEIQPELRESIRILIKRCSAHIKRYNSYKNMALLPLMICAAGLGYAAGRSG